MNSHLIKQIIYISLISCSAALGNQPEFIITEIFNETYENLQLRFDNEMKLEIPAHKKITNQIILPTMTVSESPKERTYASQKGLDHMESIVTITNDQGQTLFEIIYHQVHSVRKADKPETETQVHLQAHHIDKTFWQNTKNYIGEHNRYLIKLHFVQDANQNIIPVHSWLNVEAHYN